MLSLLARLIWEESERRITARATPNLWFRWRFNGHNDQEMLQYVDNIVCAKSPWSPVTWITYEPGRTFPIMKPPWATPVPNWITQAALPGRTTLGDEGLEIVQVWSVGRRPVALTEIHLPAWTLLSVTLASKINNTLRSNAETLTRRLLRITSTSCPVLTTSCSYL